MNAAGLAIAWCAMQIALVGVATIIAYWLVARLHQASGGFVATTGLAVVFCLSAAAASPWPRWSFLNERPAKNDDVTPGSRWRKIPIVGALVESLRGTADSSLPPRPASAAAPVAAKVAVIVRESVEEEQPRSARSLLHGMPGAFWLKPKARLDGWRWSGSLAVMFAVGLLIGGARFILALIAARSLRRQSRPIRNRRMLDLLASLKTELGSTHAIELREAARLSAPATLGWRRPAILLPSEWRTWSDRERQAVLAHEIAHVQRGDYLLWLAAQMAMTLHFYHPAVHWLAARIRLEQEFAADALAASVAGGRRVYLTTLARLTLKSAAPTGVALSFVSNRGMLLQRIERLRRHESNPPALSRWGSKFVAVGILLLAGVVASGLRGGRDDAHRPLPELEKTRPPGQAAALQDSLGPPWVGGGAQAIRF